jgi:hypothetical protein
MAEDGDLCPPEQAIRLRFLYENVWYDIHNTNIDIK